MEKVLDKLTLWNWRVVTMGVVVGVGLLALYWKYLPPEVPLFYSRPWGEDQLVSPYFLWMIPLLNLVSGVGLGFAASNLGSEDKVLPAIILVSSMIVQLILTLGLIRIVMLVI